MKGVRKMIEKDFKEIINNIKEDIKNGWGRAMLIHQIEYGYHLKIGKNDNNFKIALSKK